MLWISEYKEFYITNVRLNSKHLDLESSHTNSTMHGPGRYFIAQGQIAASTI